MKFILKNEIKKVEETQQIYTAASALDKHNSLSAKSNMKNLLASEKGLAASFGAGLAKGLLNDSHNSKHSSSKPEWTALLNILFKLQ
ncbi:hypothetical protein Q4506_17545 [Colwellia sp. 4_MG-2023]|uniref:hypothetical protein n=1 Tax=unclassified Colwellia TaxID=196834 RepID=UPI0026E426C5|nr:MULTISPECIES: hypothetical protein [unclassified Colwellia]MDO6508801.1 hypothetical protein [Colwellia sp. 5_MG-2023]MDO6557479.1 hypothetical protein [Colwellia sp. 4_MG-2023]